MTRRLRKKKPPRYLGIDPGKEGYLCVLDECGEIKTHWEIPYLGSEIDGPRLLQMLRACKLANCVYTLLEEQHPFHREGPKGAFTNGFGYGSIKMALHAAGLRFRTRKPEIWKREMGIPVPVVAKAKLPRKPSRKAAWDDWKKECDKIKGRVLRTKKGKRKDIACRLAQELAPGYDFRKSTRAKKPHDGKCESFLIARLAYKTARSNSNDDDGSTDEAA